MAQVGVQQPTNLMEMFSSPSMMLGDIASQQVNDQTLGNQINRQSASQDMDIQRQKLPFELSRMGLENQGLQAELPGKTATSSMLTDKASISRNTLPEQQKAALSDLATKVTDNELKQAEDAIKTHLTSPDPAVRKEANQMWEQISSVKEMRAKQQEETRRSMGVAGIQAGSAQKVMQMQIDAGRFKKNDKYSLGIAARIDSISNPIDKAAALIDAATQAQKAGDTDGADYYTQRAQAIENAARLKANANPKAGGVDVGQAGGIATNATPSVMPPAPAAPKQLTPQDTIALQWAKSNPQDPRAPQILQKLGVK